MKPLNWGMIGGGEGSQIGQTHLIASRLDGHFTLLAGALDHRPEVARAYAQSLGIQHDRCYGNWQDMLEGERNRPDRIDLVTIATPNATHAEITLAFLKAGFHVLCEKPMTLTVAEAIEVVKTARKVGRIVAVNYGYSGFPLVRQMRQMVRSSELGKIRMIFTEFSHGHHADTRDSGNDRIRWRYDPKQMGVSAQFADCGIHALHLATYITGQDLSEISSDLVSCVPDRTLEDDAMINFRMPQQDGGTTVGRLWTSAVAIGRQHGLAIQVFGERGGVRWCAEHPNQLYHTPLGEHTRILERGAPDLHDSARRGSRTAIGHCEGFLIAVANIYADLAQAIRGFYANHPLDPLTALYPDAKDGLTSVAAIHAAVASSKHDGEWTNARPPIIHTE